MLTCIEALGTQPTQQFTRTVAPDPRVVSDVRHDITMALRGWGVETLADDARLLVSEVLTNAIQHVPETQDITVLAAWLQPVLRVEVHDPDRTLLPKAVLPDSPTSVRGRGLPLVDALSSAWGCSPAEPDGKCVWFELRCTAV